MLLGCSFRVVFVFLHVAHTFAFNTTHWNSNPYPKNGSSLLHRLHVSTHHMFQGNMNSNVSTPSSKLNDYFDNDLTESDLDIHQSTTSSLVGGTDDIIFQDKHTWLKVFDTSQLFMVVVGFLANVVTVATLVRNGRAFSSAILILLRHQSGLDAFICTLGIGTLVQPFMWMSGNWVVDNFICHVLHSQTLYFTCVSISIHNLVVIAFERFLAVCHPFKHGSFTRGRVRAVIALLYTINLIINAPSYIQVKVKDGACVSEFLIPGQTGEIFFSAFALFCFVAFYAVPTSMFVVLYGMVIFTFKQRQRQGQFATSRVIDKATAELTKTAIVVTAIFIVSIGYDLWYYVFAYVGWLDYQMNTPEQKIGVWLTSFNSVANPFVYAFLMPAYRKSLRKTFIEDCTKRDQTQSTVVSGTTESTLPSETSTGKY